MTALPRRTVLAGLAAVALPAARGNAQDQPLRIVYPFAAGGSGDAVARLVAGQLQKDLGRPVIVENKTGAGGRIGAQAVRQAPADGSVLLLAGSSQMTLQPHTTIELGYDPVADFAPVSRLVTFDLALVVSREVPALSVPELASWLKEHPDQALYGSPGVGTIPFFAGQEVGRALGVPLRHVAYRGTPAALPDLLAGRIPIYIAAAGELIEHHKRGGVRILATFSAARSPFLPETPTLREAGIDVEAVGWFGLYAPAGTPPAAIASLETRIAAIARSPEVLAKMEALGYRLAATTADELARIQRAEFDRWGAVVKASGFTPE
jgi:tripartite-type tricarboxylate transporter receptor subunit TctC